MTFTATVYSVGKPFHVTVERGRETVHPDSLHRAGDSILDDRVPLELIIACREDGAVTVFDERPKPPDPGKEIKQRVAVVKRNGQWLILPERDGTPVKWFEHWVKILCSSHAECNHIIDLLSQGVIPSNLHPIIV